MSDTGTSPCISFFFFNYPTSVKCLFLEQLETDCLNHCVVRLHFHLGKIIGLMHALEKRYYQKYTQLRYNFGSVYIPIYIPSYLRSLIAIYVSRYLLTYFNYLAGIPILLCWTPHFLCTLSQRVAYAKICMRTNVKILLNRSIKYTSVLPHC